MNSSYFYCKYSYDRYGYFYSCDSGYFHYDLNHVWRSLLLFWLRLFCLWLLRFWLLIDIVPLSISYHFIIKLIMVVFPEPVGPMIANVLFFGISKLLSLKHNNYVFWYPRNSKSNILFNTNFSLVVHVWMKNKIIKMWVYLKKWFSFLHVELFWKKKNTFPPTI